MKHLYLLLFFTALCGFKSSAQECLENKKGKIPKEEKQDTFLDYFNLKPKAKRDFTSAEIFSAYEGLVVRDVYVKVFDRHSESLSQYDDLCESISEESKQNNSNEKLVRKQLLFASGDQIDAQLLNDNERFIRENTVFQDALIRVVPDDEGYYADVYVLIQDNRHWKVIFEASPSGIEMGVKAYDFGGVAQSFEVRGGGLFNFKNPYKVGGAYKAKNILKSKTDLKLDYTRQNLVQKPRFSLTRDFYAYNAKWAGLVDVEYTFQKVSEDPNNNRSITISSDYNLQFVKQDYWLARSFAMPNVNQRIKTMRFIIASRAFLKQHIYKPDPDKFPIQNYVDQQFYLFSVGVANRDRYGFEELYQFRTYDYVPKGGNIAVMGGYEVNEFLGNRWYTGLTTGFGHYFENFGYLNTEYRTGAFIRNRDFEQMTAQLNLNYFTNKVKLNKLGFRQFIGSSLTISYERPDTELFSFNNNVKGLRSNSLIGDKSFVMNFESVFYTPITWWTSRGNFFLYADVGYINGRDQGALFDNVLHQGYGFGIRFQHLKTTINFMELSLGYYPNAQQINAPQFGFNVLMTPGRMIGERNLFKSGVLTDIY